MPDQEALSPSDAAALARRLGSASVLRGTLARARGNVRLDVGLYDSRNLAPLTTGITVTDRADDLRALTDSVVWALLRQVWRRGVAPSPSLAAATTASRRRRAIATWWRKRMPRWPVSPVPEPAEAR